VRDAASDVLHGVGPLDVPGLVLSSEQQQVALCDFECAGFFLDIGGGTGVIGLWKGAQVVAIDRSHRELEEAPEGPLKVVMDSGDLWFPNDTFDVATAFHGRMYTEASDHSLVFQGVWRTLRPGG
jgi:trans-aconitate methyltransferase